MLCVMKQMTKKSEKPQHAAPQHAVRTVTAQPVPPISALGSYCSQNLSGFQFSHFPLSGNSDEITFLPEAFSGIAEPCLALKEMHFSGTCFPAGGVT